MTEYRKPIGRIVPAFALLAALGMPAAAQLRAVKQVIAEEAVEDLVEEVVAQPVFMFADENFDQWLYQDMQNAAGARGRLDAQLAMRLDDVVASCGLDDVQREKLHLAGRGDIKRIFDRIEQLRRQFQSVKTDQNRIGEIMQAMQPIQLMLRTGTFGETSLFAKALRSTLSSEQVDRYESADRERRQFRYQAVVEAVVTRLDEDLVLLAAQRGRLVQTLLAETRPPANFGQYDPYVVMLQAARLPEEKLKPLFDEPQWKMLKKQFEQARGLEPFLKANGFLPDSAPGSAPGAAAGAAGIPPGVLFPAVRRARVVAPAGGF
jgi:hypothetical protein